VSGTDPEFEEGSSSGEWRHCAINCRSIAAIATAKALFIVGVDDDGDGNSDSDDTFMRARASVTGYRLPVTGY
jgi:hypothetical protein